MPPLSPSYLPLCQVTLMKMAILLPGYLPLCQVTLMKMSGEVMTGGGKAGTWYAKAEGDGGPIDSWCGELGLEKYSKRLSQDTAAPLSIDRVGTFDPVQH